MRKHIGWALGLAGWICGSVYGAGFQLYTEGSAEALGQAAAISGRNDLVSLAWYNPAALAGTGRSEIMVGTCFVTLNTGFSGAAGSASISDEWRVIPHAYYVQPVSDRLTALLSVNAPYGLITEWSADWIGNLAATYSDFSAIYITPSLAYRLNDRLALGAGINVVSASAELSANRDFSALNPALPDFGRRTVKGDDVGYGYTASAHGDLGNGWALGARFLSRVKVKLEGTVDFQTNPLVPGTTTFPVQASIDLPASANIGLAKRLAERLTMDLDLVWTEWSTYDELVYHFSAGYPVIPGVTSNPEVNSKRWENVWSVRIGGEYEVSDQWVLRAGYVWDQSPVPESTRSPELPGSNRQMVMAGLGWRGERLSLDLAYSCLWAEEAATGSEVVARIPMLAGSYKTVSHIVGLSGGWSF